MQDILFKSNSGQFSIDEALGIVECFVAGIGNKDSVGDIVISGAFSKSLIRRKPRVVWGHNWNDPIGKVLEIYEVPPNDPRLPPKMKLAGIGGLYAKVQFNLNSEKGKEAFTNVAFFGEEQEWSIGYKTLDAIYDNSKQANILREVELYELSPVLHGANQLTGTISVKSDDEKMHMMHMMPGAAVAVTEKPQAPVDPFAQGVAQPANSDRTAALERELSARTGGPIKVMKANESSVIFLKPGKGMFRLGYYFDGEQYMFGKPEKLGATMIVQQGMPNAQPRPTGVTSIPNVQGKPSIPQPIIPVKYGNDSASGFFDLDNDEKTLTDKLNNIVNNEKNDMSNSSVISKLNEIVGSLQEVINQHNQLEKTEFLIPCEPQQIFSTKQALDPVFDYHRIETYVTEDGIIIASPLSADAYEAVENATKSLLGRIGRGIGGGGKVRRGRAALAKITGVLDRRKRRDANRDGYIFDGTWMEMPDPTPPKPITSGKPVPVRRTANPPTPGNVGGRTLRITSKPMQVDDPAPELPEPRRLRSGGRNMEHVEVSGSITLPRTTKPRVKRMFDDVIQKNNLNELSALVRVAKLFELSTRRRTGANDFDVRIPKDVFEKAKQEYADLREQFKIFGAHRTAPDGKKEKGRSAFDVIDEVMETGGYTPKVKGRKRKTTQQYQGPRVREGGGAQNVTRRAGAEGRVDKGKRRDKTPYEELNLPKLYPTRGMMPSDRRYYGPDFFKEWIARGVLPKNWNDMSAAEKFDWWFSPSGEGDKTQNNGERILEMGRYRQQGILMEWSVLVGRVRDKIIQDDADTDPEYGKSTYQDALLRALEKNPAAREIHNENVRKQNKEHLKRMRILRKLNKERALEGKEPLDELPRDMWPKSSLDLEKEIRGQIDSSAKPKAGKKPPKRPKKQTMSREAWSDNKRPELQSSDTTQQLISETAKYVEASRDRLLPGVKVTVDDALTEMREALSSDLGPKGQITPKGLQNAYEILVNAISEIRDEIDSVTASARDSFRDGRRERLQKPDVRNRLLAEGLDTLASHIYDRFSSKDDSTDELLGDDDSAFGALARQGRSQERYGLGGDDDDIESGADIDEIYGDTSMGLGGFEDDNGDEVVEAEEGEMLYSGRRIEKAQSVARKFRKNYAMRREGGNGRLASGRGGPEQPKTEITNEATWWQKIDGSLDREISKAKEETVQNGLQLLRRLIIQSGAKKYRPGGKRTNVASIRFTASEADQILDAVMAVIDRQKTAGKDGGVGSRGELFAELLEKVASQAMSTFVDKTSAPVPPEEKRR